MIRSWRLRWRDALVLKGLRRRLRRCQITSSLRHALEEFVAFAQTADADVLVLEHRLDDAENRFRAQVVAMVEAFDAFEDFVFAESRILQRALLEAVAFHEVGLVLLHEPAVLTRHLVKFGAGIWRGEGDLQ